MNSVRLKENYLSSCVVKERNLWGTGLGKLDEEDSTSERTSHVSATES